MKNILFVFSIILITVLISGCSKANNDNFDKYYCEKDADCADCCTGECVNYDYWNHNAPNSIAGECACMHTCTCNNNKCTKDN